MDLKNQAKLFLKSFFLSSFWNDHVMQNIGFLFCLDGWLTERLKLDGAELKEARSRHL
ncbi:MAG: PTS mannose transporter subunit IID, partial [Elusimicrobia bacterium]|nr:PTS mannose transporter subunit IID [Elusimicrobiota bacterium]